MRCAPLPAQACWRHEGARAGFEVLFASTVGDVHRLRGTTTGLEDGLAWSIGYDVELDARWRTRTAVVRVEGRDGSGELLLERDDLDRWSVDGLHWPDLDGCVDVDLVSSAVTNTLPVHRLDLVSGRPVRVDAVLVGLDLRVSRLTQTYALTAGGPGTGDLELAYTAPVFDFAATLRFDAAGLVLDYPGIAVRHA